MFIRILFIALLVGYFIWIVNKKLLNNDIALARVIAATLVLTSLVYLILGGLSYLIEGS
tara:strand:- start:102 stop:278 length:177 start_codon:yes stop_codon:yes gene_type:complete